MRAWGYLGLVLLMAALVPVALLLGSVICCQPRIYP